MGPERQQDLVTFLEGLIRFFLKSQHASVTFTVFGVARDHVV